MPPTSLYMFLLTSSGSKRYLVVVGIVMYKGEDHEDSRMLKVEHSHWWTLMRALFMSGFGLTLRTINRQLRCCSCLVYVSLSVSLVIELFCNLGGSKYISLSRLPLDVANLTNQ